MGTPRLTKQNLACETATGKARQNERQNKKRNEKQNKKKNKQQNKRQNQRQRNDGNINNDRYSLPHPARP
ncbi:MAG: hypothetical protein ACYDBL_13120 [Candidatus Acidiferrales bacterium]